MSSQIGVIHEIGDYADIEPLSAEEQRKVQEQYRRRDENDRQKQAYHG